ncbi:hypothetical protein GGR21_003643 [Dysgonomonas hofstadii]|uniref:NigD-like protein n=1 Tax=Dysgonomonas hofstadii TaxID=637886 RepID=A0A840CZ88_9BACT|nr:hypothetical protein [Dysgonomonas hofstadii]MBB4037722.1 hypothetical protein [Dysgonomonas hofstadii]
MKVSLMKLIGSLSCAALLMTSCLGDGDSSFQSDRSFAYITTDANYIKVASTNVGYIRTQDATGMTNLTDGQCYYISFKITSTQSSSGTYPAEYINVLDDGPISQKSLYVTELGEPGEAYPGIEEEQSDTIQVNSLELREYYPAKEVFGDRWLFRYSVPNRKDDDQVKAYFYFDRDNQVNEKGEAIGFSENKIVIDVRFTKIDGSGSGTTKTKDYESVGNLSSLRNYTPKYNDAGEAYVAVKFRYVTPATTTTPPTAKFYPTGDSAWVGDSNSSFFLYYNTSN